jgi:hypothetical protein
MIQAFGRCGDIKTAFALGKKVPGPVFTYLYLYFLCPISIVDSLMFFFFLFSVDEMVANRYELTSSVYRNGKVHSLSYGVATPL